MIDYATKKDILYVRTEKLVPKKVAMICTALGFYTWGDVSDYDNMIKMCENWDGTMGGLYDIANDIIAHSKDDLRTLHLTDYEYIGFVIRKLLECVDDKVYENVVGD